MWSCPRGSPRAIRPSSQAPTCNWRYVTPGTGLGLSTVYGIVQQSDASILLRTAPDQGSSFEIYFPPAPLDEPCEPSARSDAPAATGHETVLLVEDECALRPVTARVLRELGYTVVEAADGVEALEILTQRSPRGVDLLFVDLTMPRLGGLALVDRVRAEHPDVAVLLTTGHDPEAEGVAPAGPDQLLRKPYGVANLAAAVRQALDRHSRGSATRG
jgi:CheY-like chemotaxis protein